MRILHIITRLDCGGSAENTLLTALGQHAMGHDVSIVCGYSDNPESCNEARARSKGISISRIRHLVRPIHPLYDLLALFILYRHIRRVAPDLVHTHTSKAGILGRIAARAANAAAVVHTPHGHIFYGYFSGPLTAFFVVCERLLMKCTHALITLTNQEKNDYLAKGIGPAAKIHPILSGIDLDPFLTPPCTIEEARHDLGLSADTFVAGTVARLVPVKNHDLILSAAAIICADNPRARFVFVGDGELRGTLETRARELRISSRIIFAGWHQDVSRILPAFDLFIMCSHNEGMGRAFVEAQAAGIPVIGSRVGGIPEVMRHGETGFLVSPNDPQELAERIGFFIANPDSLIVWKERCREWARSRFSAAAMVDAIEHVYSPLKGKRHKVQK